MLYMTCSYSIQYAMCHIQVASTGNYSGKKVGKG